MQDEPAFLSSAPRLLPLALEDRVCSCRVHALLAVVAPAKHESKFRSPGDDGSALRFNHRAASVVVEMGWGGEYHSGGSKEVRV